MLAVTSSMIPDRPGEPLDARAVVDTVADIKAIPLPYVGLIVFCREDGKYYSIRTLAPKQIGSFQVENAAVGDYRELHVDGEIWHEAEQA